MVPVCGKITALSIMTGTGVLHLPTQCILRKRFYDVCTKGTRRLKQRSYLVSTRENPIDSSGGANSNPMEVRSKGRI